jgi:hypothetical protein
MISGLDPRVGGAEFIDTQTQPNISTSPSQKQSGPVGIASSSKVPYGKFYNVKKAPQGGWYVKHLPISSPSYSTEQARALR